MFDYYQDYIQISHWYYYQNMDKQINQIYIFDEHSQQPALQVFQFDHQDSHSQSFSQQIRNDCISETQKSGGSYKHKMFESTVQESIKELPKDYSQTSQLRSLQSHTTLRVTNIKSFLSSPLPEGFTLTCIITIQRNGVLNLNPIYVVHLPTEKKIIMAAKQLLLSSPAQYIISMTKFNITRRSKSYLANITSNFYGTKWIMSQESNPMGQPNQKELKPTRKQLAYVEFQWNFMGINGPRVFKALIPNIGPDNQAKQIRQFEDENQLANVEEHDIIELKNKSPVFDEREKVFILNFKGKVKEPSAKNFILVDRQQKQCLIFGKQNDTEYVMELKYPLSPLQAFGICLCSISKKLVVE